MVIGGCGRGVAEALQQGNKMAGNGNTVNPSLAHISTKAASPLTRSMQKSSPFTVIQHKAGKGNLRTANEDPYIPRTSSINTTTSSSSSIAPSPRLTTSFSAFSPTRPQSSASSLSAKAPVAFFCSRARRIVKKYVAITPKIQNNYTLENHHGQHQ